MLVELTLTADENANYAASDLGYLLHKNPSNVFRRATAAGIVTIFFPERGEKRASAVLHLEVDPVALVRGKSAYADGLLDQYVNDRPYVANSFLSVAVTRALGQSLAGKSKERQALADQPLPFEARIAPIAVSGGMEVIHGLFEPHGYEVTGTPFDESGPRVILDLKLKGRVRLAELLAHIYVLVPVLDDNKHYWIESNEVEKFLAKGEGWLETHPAKTLITRRALKHRRALVRIALDLLSEGLPPEDDADEEGDETGTSNESGKPARMKPETDLEKPIRLHDVRLDRVAQVLQELGASSVLDLGCGEVKLMRSLIKSRGIRKLIGVDPSVRTLEVAARRLHLDTAGEDMRERVSLQMGSLTYGDRRWHGFDAATPVEVIEHIDPPRLSALELSLFGDARPRHVIVTTPNVEYNALFETMTPGTLRHVDHRFEWTRAEFESWASGVAEQNGYAVRFEPLGPLDVSLGAPSQMAVFFDRRAPVTLPDFVPEIDAAREMIPAPVARHELHCEAAALFRRIVKGTD
jgi:3' terminal RNA ribose 2'-O-methyltransferase Hen1